MQQGLNRRQFLGSVSTSLAVAASLPKSTLSAAAAETSAASHGLKKAVKLGMVKEQISLAEKFVLLKELGYDGVEMASPNGHESASKVGCRPSLHLVKQWHACGRFDSPT